jgi:hypothetical protein
MKQKILYSIIFLLLAVLLFSIDRTESRDVPLWYTQSDSLKATITKQWLTFGKVVFNRNGVASGITLTAPKIGTNGMGLDSIKVRGSAPDTVYVYIGSKVAKLPLNAF